MSRIVAGAAGGLKLRSVPGNATRPTTDRVKESLFSRLESWGMLADARVLDLFAGSGALGCEAGSRGAASVHLVEREARAAAVCQHNARTVNQALRRSVRSTEGGADDGIDGPAEKPVVTVTRRSVSSFLTEATGPWDLVLADPPYPLTEVELTDVLAPLAGRLGPGAVIVVERSSRSPEPTWPRGLRRLEVSRHGETTLWYAEEDPDGPAISTCMAT